MTPPVQRNFFAVGHKYILRYGDEAGRPIRYLGSVTMSNGSVEHIFWYEASAELLGNQPIAITEVLADRNAHHFIKEE